MPQLGLLLWLLAAPTPDVGSTARPAERPCEVARQIAASGPCLRPEDCDAFSDWQRLFGRPRTEPLDPRSAALGNRRPEDLPGGYLCLAGQRSARHPGRR